MPTPSDLPSREETAEALIQYKGANVSVGPVTRANVLTTFRKVAEAHAAGRLVDREAVYDFLVSIESFDADPVVAFASAFLAGDTG